MRSCFYASFYQNQHLTHLVRTQKPSMSVLYLGEDVWGERRVLWRILCSKCTSHSSSWDEAPQECRVVPDADHVSQETVLALVEFYEGRSKAVLLQMALESLAGEHSFTSRSTLIQSLLYADIYGQGGIAVRLKNCSFVMLERNGHIYSQWNSYGPGLRMKYSILFYSTVEWSGAHTSFM